MSAYDTLVCIEIRVAEQCVTRKVYLKEKIFSTNTGAITNPKTTSNKTHIKQFVTRLFIQSLEKNFFIRMQRRNNI